MTVHKGVPLSTDLPYQNLWTIIRISEQISAWTYRHPLGRTDTNLDVRTPTWTYGHPSRHPPGRTDTHPDVRTPTWTYGHPPGHTDTHLDVRTCPEAAALDLLVVTGTVDERGVVADPGSSLVAVPARQATAGPLRPRLPLALN